MEKKKKDLLIAALITIIATFALAALLTARKPEVSTVMEVYSEYWNLYRVVVKATTSPLTIARITIETNGEVVEAVGNYIGPIHRDGPGRWTIFMMPTVETVRHLDISFIVRSLSGDELRCNVTVSTPPFGSAFVSTEVIN